MWSLGGIVKHIVLVGVLLFSSLSFADAGTPAVVVDAGTIDVVLDAGAVVEADAGVEVLDAGTTDAGAKLVDGDNVDVVGIVKKAQEAGHDKNWSILFIIASVVVGLTWLLRKFGGLFIPFLKTDRGGAVTVLVLGVAGGLVNALAAGSSVTLDVVVSGMGVGFMSAGGFTVLKKLLFPSDAPEPPKS